MFTAGPSTELAAGGSFRSVMLCINERVNKSTDGKVQGRAKRGNMVQEAGPKSARRIETPSSPYDPTSRSSTEPWDQKNSFPIKSSARAFGLFERVTGAPESTWHGHAHSSSSQDQFLQS